MVSDGRFSFLPVRSLGRNCPFDSRIFSNRIQQSSSQPSQRIEHNRAANQYRHRPVVVHWREGGHVDKHVGLMDSICSFSSIQQLRFPFIHTTVRFVVHIGGQGGGCNAIRRAEDGRGLYYSLCVCKEGKKDTVDAAPITNELIRLPQPTNPMDLLRVFWGGSLPSHVPRVFPVTGKV